MGVPRAGQERSGPRPPRAAGRRGLAAPPSRRWAPSRIPGRGPAGARAGPTRRRPRAGRWSTAWTYGCGPTLTRSWALRLSPRATASGSPKHAATCWASSRRLA
eukprot:7776597-Alexandrium_andersonii.AAC.1